MKTRYFTNLQLPDLNCLRRLLMRRFFLVSCFLFVVSHALFAQLSFDHITVANGLSQSTVLSVTKDSRGYLWFATRDRLNRYDARHIKVYNHSYEDSNSISCSDYTYFVLEDRSKHLWVGTVKGLNRYLPATDGFEHIWHKPADNNSISDNNVFCGFQDSRGRLWFGTGNGLNCLPSPDSRRFARYYKGTAQQPGLAGNQVNVVYEDHLHRLWIGANEGLTCMTPKGNGYTFTQQLSGNAIKAIAEDRQGYLWVGTTTDGLYRYQLSTAKVTHYTCEAANPYGLSSNDVRRVMPARDGKIWIGTMTGLNIFDTATQQFTHYEHDAEDRSSLSDNSIKEIYQDDNGSIWIGTMFGGVNVVHPGTIPFQLYQHNTFKNSISNNIVSAITADAQGNLWIGTEGNGLNHFNKTSGRFTACVHTPGNKRSLAANSVKALYRDKANNLWIGLHQGGLDMCKPGAGSFVHYRNNAADSNTISSDIVSCMLEDSQDRFWIGTSKGLNLMNRQNGTFRRYIIKPQQPLRLSSDGIRCMYEDTRHNLWVGTTGGLNLLRAGTEVFTWFGVNEQNTTMLSAGYINCITEDSSGTVWIGAFHGGLNRYNAASGSFTRYTTRQGLPSDNILNIQQDDRETLWVTTDNGMFTFHLTTGKVKVFTVKDGLPTNEFNYSSGFKDAGGDLYFGTYNGLVRFSPGRMKENGVAPQVVFTGLKLFNEPVAIGDNTALLHQDISVTQSLRFTHQQNVFTIDFSALNYNKPERNAYSYRLEGFETHWNYVTVPSATYTNLPAGNYRLLVRAGNNDGIWSDQPAVMAIVVLPPVWNTWWAWLLYVALAAIVLYLVTRFYRRQARWKRELYYEQLHHERQQQLHLLQLDFFTRISHEIRTPLTLIAGPVEKAMELTGDNPVLARQLDHIKQNSNRLIRLVNELLDFRKIESGHMQLHVTERDLVSFCRDSYLSFESMAAARHMHYLFEAPDTPMPAWFDAAQLEKVLFNLLANAFKFTPDNGTITVSVKAGDTHLQVLVEDTGSGISEKDLPYIFDHFYQEEQAAATQGWGIGLALARHITTLHKGTIDVTSTGPAGARHTVFTVSLLSGNTHFAPEALAGEQATGSTGYTLINELATTAVRELLPAGAGKPLLLLAEDNEDVRGFIKESLNDAYAITECANGLEAWETACRLVPDIIISDIAMPEMDGLALCGRLKTDERTCHIPVILLTAKAAHTHLVGGLKTGADAYITKPFSMQVLELHLRNLLAAREAMRHKYAQQVTLMPENKVIASPDALFLDKLMQLLQQHMENPEFDVEALVKAIGMSQTVLYRKIKALTGLAITEFIKTARLKQAAQLLAQQKMSIAEVAYAVGFNDRKYFSKEFKKQFGQAPSEYEA